MTVVQANEINSMTVNRYSRFGKLTTAATLVFVAFALGRPVVHGQAAEKIYRGSIGGNHIEMRLKIEGNKVSGTYSYDRVREDIRLSGQLDAQGRLALTESGAKNRPTGKFDCKRKLGDQIDSECTWSRPDGTGQAFVTLDEQHIAFTNGLQVIPKVIANRKTGVTVSYPQLTGGTGGIAPAIENFNNRLSQLANKAVKDFEPEATTGTYFEMNYNVLLGSNDLVSVEIYQDYYAGGVHPDSGYFAITYELAANREFGLDDLFKPVSDYKAAIAKYALTDIDKRAAQIEQEEAQREGRKVERRDKPVVSADQLPDIQAWAMTPNGLMIYFDFPHVIAVFDKNFIPYTVVKDYLKPDGPAAKFAGVRQ